ncbi:molybdate ABC transporter substrate-binding protein [Aliiroseovarius marinus]|uniref:molybdate ABC transporter substrate-binding protein n=1 Tax=Aliiroseovarius marinus TaxID=2500159 RepID=UPI003D7CEF0F
MSRNRTLPHVIRPVLFGLALVVMTGSGSARAGQLLVFAAASLSDVLEETAAAYTDQSGNQVTISPAGSSVLARQILQGAPADLFISANTDWMDHLAQKNAILPETRQNIATNQLVLISAQPDATVDLADPDGLPDALGDGRLSMALTEAVPAGQYGRAALSALGLWESLAPQVAEADNVRAALALVALGAAPFGITYATDALAEPRVHITATFPPELHAPILYPAAVTRQGQQNLAQDFLHFLTSPDAQAIFAAQGFEPATEVPQ